MSDLHLAIQKLISEYEKDLSSHHGYVDPDENDLSRHSGQMQKTQEVIADLKLLLQNEREREHRAAMHWIDKILDKLEETVNHHNDQIMLDPPM